MNNMIDYIEYSTNLASFREECTLKEYFFAFQLAMGVKPVIAYVNSILVDDHNDKSIALVRSSYAVAKNDTDAKKYAKRKNIDRLVNLIKADIDAEIEKQALKVGGSASYEGKEPTRKEIKRWLGMTLRKAADSPNDVDYKEFNANIKLFLSEFAEEDDPSKKIDKFIMHIHPNVNGICGNTDCNREIDLIRGAAVICPFCGAINDNTNENKNVVYVNKEQYNKLSDELIIKEEED